MTAREISADLVVDNLSIAYATAAGTTVQIIEDFSFTAGPGDFVCLAGRSGSGKTSILRNLVGLAADGSGAIRWNKRALRTMTASETAALRRKTAAYLDQEAGLVDELTCLENVVLPAVPSGRRHTKSALQQGGQHLARFGLAQRERARPATLSGGERQRTVLARVLTAGTPAIVADEPTASLDRAWADVVIGILRDHADRGGTVVVASHDPVLAEAADRVLRIEERAPTR